MRPLRPLRATLRPFEFWEIPWACTQLGWGVRGASGRVFHRSLGLERDVSLVRVLLLEVQVCAEAQSGHEGRARLVGVELRLFEGSEENGVRGVLLFGDSAFQWNLGWQMRRRRRSKSAAAAVGHAEHQY